jgi:hypothetical protein
MYDHYSFSLNIQRNAFKIGAENQIVGRITSHKMANFKAAGIKLLSTKNRDDNLVLF